MCELSKLKPQQKKILYSIFVIECGGNRASTFTKLQKNLENKGPTFWNFHVKRPFKAFSLMIWGSSSNVNPDLDHYKLLSYKKKGLIFKGPQSFGHSQKRLVHFICDWKKTPPKIILLSITDLCKTNQSRFYLAIPNSVNLILDAGLGHQPCGKLN